MKTILLVSFHPHFSSFGDCGHMCNCPRNNIHMVQKENYSLLQPWETCLNFFLPWLVMLHPWTHFCPCYPNLPLLELNLEPHLLLLHIRLHLINSFHHPYWYQDYKHLPHLHLHQLHNNLLNLSEGQSTQTKGQNTLLRVTPLNLSYSKCSIKLPQIWKPKE